MGSAGPATTTLVEQAERVVPRCRSLVAGECNVGAPGPAREYQFFWTTARATWRSVGLRRSEAIPRSRNDLASDAVDDGTVTERLFELDLRA